MSDFADKIATLLEKKQKLLAEEQRLMEQRMQEIAQLAKRCDMLGVSDACLAGLFLSLQDAIQTASPLVKELQTRGELFLKNKKDSSTTRARETTADSLA